jgi:hypothetical protein
MRSWTSTPCATACPTGSSADHVDEQIVRIFHGTTLVATHARAGDPFSRVIDPAHYAGL